MTAKKMSAKKKWLSAEKHLDLSREWLGVKESHSDLASVLIRASMTYDDESDEGKDKLGTIGMALGLLHPVDVFGACSNMVTEGTHSVIHKFFDEEDMDDDGKIATCKAIKFATNAVCDLITSTGFWNSKDVVRCLQETADLLDKQRIEDELTGNDVTGVNFCYNFEEGSMEIINSIIKDEEEHGDEG
jgi:hypothetical protein